MKRFLVGVDGSWESREATRCAANLAKSTGSGVRLATVVSFHKAFGAPELEVQVATWEEEEKARSARMLGKIAGTLRRRGVPVETIVLCGPTAEALCEEATRAEIEFVVIGYRGRGALRRVLPGSVAERLLQISPKPVLVVRPVEERPKRKPGAEKKAGRTRALQLVHSSPDASVIADS
jgi:nucleotide-binding universal stress UspA family protein